jgi:hypothetical protein
MTIDRMLRRGVFPILSERPLDESETRESATAKVYVVEVGAYSDRYIDAIFTSRELAEAFVEDRKRRAFARNGNKARREPTGWSAPEGVMGSRWEIHSGTGMPDGPTITVDGVTFPAKPTGYRDVPAETFEEFLARHTWNEFGDVDEYDLWDVLPVVDPAP